MKTVNSSGAGLRHSSGRIRNAAKNIPAKTNIHKLGLRPEAIRVVGPSKGILKGRISVCEYLGSEQLVYIDCGLEELLTVRLKPSDQLREGEIVGIAFDISDAHFFDSVGRRLNETS